MANLADSIDKDDAAEAEELAVEFESLGYPRAAEQVRAYVSMVRACRQYCLATVNETRAMSGEELATPDENDVI